jgi:ribonucleotide reductase beta subunit family protein with ferritin-like domain
MNIQVSEVEEKDVERRVCPSPPVNPFAAEGSGRYTLFPIKFQEIWEHYKKQQRSFWTVEEIDLSKERIGWQGLSDHEQHFIKMVLAFFAASDGIVMRNISENFLQEVEVPEACICYAWQNMIEGIHSEMYSVLIDTIIPDTKEQDRLFASMETIPTIRKKAEWALRWIDSKTATFAQRLVAFAAVEGIFFSGSFASIFWLRKRKIEMPGLFLSNEFISRDEGMHTEYACLLYRILRRHGQGLGDQEFHQLMREAVEVEQDFVKSAVPVALVGMNADLMAQYIEYVADRLMESMGHEKLYRVKNPFPWMETISMAGKTNFFEKRSGDYGMANVKTAKTQHTHEFQFVKDF